ncbi:hypothetical protein GCM10007874_37150 [Labrys miyagiensis]|uniref:Uncharacterized protein n=1 Tax=Labrys miyagiensis TaxID=346912 RepID=A0ABQ6CK74_9HYPH|nr:hypothetical protein GCM10007874_37150 [Labrys miyagiensis]
MIRPIYRRSFAAVGPCRVASPNFVTECLTKDVTRSRTCGSDAGHLDADFADEPLHRFLTILNAVLRDGASWGLETRQV